MDTKLLLLQEGMFRNEERKFTRAEVLPLLSRVFPKVDSASFAHGAVLLRKLVKESMVSSDRNFVLQAWYGYFDCDCGLNAWQTLPMVTTRRFACPALNSSLKFKTSTEHVPVASSMALTVDDNKLDPVRGSASISSS